MAKSAIFNPKPAMVPNPWDGGFMTLRQFFDREEDEKHKDYSHDLTSVLPKSKEQVMLNHVRYRSVAYQLLWYDDGTGYSSQSLFFRKHRGKNPFKPIALDCHIPMDYILVIADAFEKGGVKAAKDCIGVD